jgi:hypothetical protein
MESFARIKKITDINPALFPSNIEFSIRPGQSVADFAKECDIVSDKIMKSDSSSMDAERKGMLIEKLKDALRDAIARHGANGTA